MYLDMLSQTHIFIHVVFLVLAPTHSQWTHIRLTKCCGWVSMFMQH